MMVMMTMVRVQASSPPCSEVMRAQGVCLFNYPGVCDDGHGVGFYDDNVDDDHVDDVVYDGDDDHDDGALTLP